MVPINTPTRGATHNLGPVGQLPPGEGRLFEIGPDAHLVAVFRTRAGAVYATQAQCPHRGGPLSDGTTGGTILVCPLHGCRFDLATGGGPLDDDCEALKTFPINANAAGELILTL